MKVSPARVRLVGLVSIALLLSGCSAADDLQGSEQDQTLHVFAAASLSSTFTLLAAQFEQEHPHVKVLLSFDGSSSLASQIMAGAPADVFASADQATMDRVAGAGLLQGTATPFASNTLILVVPAHNPAKIQTFAEAARPGVKLVMCAPQLPCGAAAQADAASAGLSLAPVSEELSVTSVLAKVTSGEADAGLVYVTDAQSAGNQVTTVALSVPNPRLNSYPIAAMKDSKSPELTQDFVELVTSSKAREVFREAGFGAP